MNTTLLFIDLIAQSDTASKGSSFGPLIMIGLMFVVMWVVMIRPQQKRQKEQQNMINAIKKGDQVVTIGGLHAKVNSIGEKTVSLKIGDTQFLTFEKSSIAKVLNKKEDKEEKKDNKEEKNSKSDKK